MPRAAAGWCRALAETPTRVQKPRTAAGLLPRVAAGWCHALAKAPRWAPLSERDVVVLRGTAVVAEIVAGGRAGIESAAATTTTATTAPAFTAAAE